MRSYCLCRPSPKQDNRQAKVFTTSGLPGGGNGGTIGAGSSAASFRDFQESVDDAWDSGDDEFCMVSDVKISKRVSQSAAMSVINSHRSGGGCGESLSNSKKYQLGKNQEIIPEEKRIEALQRLAVQPLHLRNDRTSGTTTAICPSTRIRCNTEAESEVDDKIVCSPHRVNTQFPGRPQALRQSTTASKFFLPSKEQDGESKVDKFQSLLETSLLNLDELRQLSWSGVPAKLRSVTWRLLSVSLMFFFFSFNSGKYNIYLLFRNICRQIWNDVSKFLNVNVWII